MHLLRRIIIAGILAALLLLSTCEQLTPLGSLIEDQLQLPPPTMDAPAADANGYSNTDIVVTLNHDDPSVDLYYTTDRSDPGSGGTRYTGPFTLSGHNVPLLVKALARKTRQLDSDTIQSEFLILYDAAEAPVLSPPGGSFNSAIAVDMSSSSGGAAVWYTTDGTDPRGSATRVLYDGTPIDMADDGTPDGSRIVINAVAQVVGLPDSPIVTEEYIVLYDTLSMPVLSPVTAQSEDPIDVTMSSPDGGEIWFTIDGSSPISGIGSAAVPSSTAQLYTTPVSINWSGYDSRTIKAACFASGARPSAVQFGSYFRQLGQTPTPTVEIYNPDDGLAIAAVSGTVYTNAASPAARIASAPTGTRYFYTTDGTMPMISVSGSSIDLLTPATLELSGAAPLPITEGPHELNIVAVNTGSDPSHLVTVPVTVDRTAPSSPGITPSGLTNAPDSNTYLNAARWADNAWSVNLSGGGGGNGTFEWSWVGSGTSQEIASTSIGGVILKADIPASQGSKTLQVRERDHAGNWSNWTNLAIVLDTVAPTLAGAPPYQYPSNMSIGQTLDATDEFYIRFNEAMDPTSVGLIVRVYGGATVGSIIASSGNTRFDRSIPSGLNLDEEYQFSFTGATDMAGNPYGGSSMISRFVTGALFWSTENRIYRAPITSRAGYSVTEWRTEASGTTITDIEVGDGWVIWTQEDSGGEGSIRRSASKNPTASTVYTVNDVSTGAIGDLEIDIPNQRIFYTSPDNAWSIRSQNYLGTGGNGEELGANPSNLAWDGSDYYWTGGASAFYYSGAGPLYDPGDVVSGTSNLSMDYRLSGSERQFYTLNAYYIPNPPNEYGSSGIRRQSLSLDMGTATGSTGGSIQSELYAPSASTHGGDLEIVEIGGINRIYALAPTITGTPIPARTNEYCAVFSMDLNLGGLQEHYNPFSLGLTHSLDGGLAIDTE